MASTVFLAARTVIAGAFVKRTEAGNEQPTALFSEIVELEAARFATLHGFCCGFPRCGRKRMIVQGER